LFRIDRSKDGRDKKQQDMIRYRFDLMHNDNENDNARKDIV